MFKTLSSKAKTLVQVAKVLAILAKCRLRYGHAVTDASVNVLVDLQNLTGQKFDAIRAWMDTHELVMVLGIDLQGDYVLSFAIGELTPIRFELPRQPGDMREFGLRVGAIVDAVIAIVLESDSGDLEVYQ